MFLFIIVALLFIIAVINNLTSYDTPCDLVYLDTLDLKTGDIVGVSYSNVAGGFVSSFSRSIWSHTGNIWVDPKNGLVYVLEGVMYPLVKYRGFIKVPFDIWYKYNCNFTLGIKKYRGPEIDPEKMIQTFSLFKDCKLEGFNYTWGRFLRNDKYWQSCSS